MDNTGRQVFRLGQPGPVVAVDAGGVAPVSAVYLWLRRGAAAETQAELGAAHLLEHMLFKGAGGHGPSGAASRIEGMGGDLNAFTSYEQTVLHATVPAGREVEVIGLLSEMAFGPHLDEGELAREHDVVIEELRGAQDDPADRLAEALRARAHRGHPYGRPILGTESSVRGLDAAALRRFHLAHHRPEQAILAVAGPVHAEEILAAARAAFDRAGTELGAPAPAGAAPRPQARPSPGAFVIRGFEERLVELAWPLPPLSHPDMAALDLLATALGDGDAAVLSRRLRDEEEVASDAWAALEVEPDRSLLVVGAQARRGKALACAQALAREVAAVAERGVPAAALRRARRAVLGSRLVDRETVDGRANRLAWYLACYDDPDADALYEGRIRAVRGEDLVRVARAWLRPEAAVAGAVAPPHELTGPKLQRAVQGVAVGRAAAAGGLVRRVLSCGATVVIEPDPHAELAALSVVGVGGLLAEGAGAGGLAGAWAQVVTRGAGELDAGELAAAVEDRAGTLRAWRARNSLGVEARFPEADLDVGLGLLLRVLTRPLFPEDEVARARDDLDEARESLLHDDPAGLAWQLAWGALYPGHPWGRLSLGSAASVARIGPAGLRRYHRKGIVGRNLVIGAAGAVDPDELVQRLERGLAELPPGAPVSPRPPVVADRLQVARKRRSGREQAHLVLAFPALGHGDPAAPAQRLLEGLLSGQSGRLFLEVREARGLAYGVDASAVEGLGGGTLLISAAVDPGRVEEAKAALWQTLAAAREQAVPEDELQRVKARVVDGAVLGLQRASDRAAHLAAAERYGPGAGAWREQLQAPRRVDAAALQALARQVLRPDRCVLAEVGPHVGRRGR